MFGEARSWSSHQGAAQYGYREYPREHGIGAILRHKMKALLDLIAGRSDDLELDRAALALARIEYPGLDIEPFIAILDSYAVELASRIGDCSDGLQYVEAT